MGVQQNVGRNVKQRNVGRTVKQWERIVKAVESMGAQRNVGLVVNQWAHFEKLGAL